MHNLIITFFLDKGESVPSCEGVLNEPRRRSTFASDDLHHTESFRVVYVKFIHTYRGDVDRDRLLHARGSTISGQKMIKFFN